MAWQPTQSSVASGPSRSPRGSASSSPPGVAIQPSWAREYESRNSRIRRPAAKDTGVAPRSPEPNTASTSTSVPSGPGAPNRTPDSPSAR